MGGTDFLLDHGPHDDLGDLGVLHVLFLAGPFATVPPDHFENGVGE